MNRAFIFLAFLLLVGGCKATQCDPAYHAVREFALSHNLHFEVSLDNTYEPWGVHLWSRGTHWYNDSDYCYRAAHCWRGFGDSVDEAFQSVKIKYEQEPLGQQSGSYEIETKCKE